MCRTRRDARTIRDKWFLRAVQAVELAELFLASPQRAIEKAYSMGQKRSHTEAMETSSSPFIPMFEKFRAELDEHHDRRERTIKASRDITAASKKM